MTSIDNLKAMGQLGLNLDWLLAQLWYGHDSDRRRLGWAFNRYDTTKFCDDVSTAAAGESFAVSRRTEIFGSEATEAALRLLTKARSAWRSCGDESYYLGSHTIGYDGEGFQISDGDDRMYPATPLEALKFINAAMAENGAVR